MVGLRYVSCVNDFKMIRHGVGEFKLSLLWKMNFFWKRGKWDKLREFLELIRIKLWCVYVWATMIICVMWIYFVDVFKHGSFAFDELLEKWWILWK